MRNPISLLAVGIEPGSPACHAETTMLARKFFSLQTLSVLSLDRMLVSIIRVTIHRQTVAAAISGGKGSPQTRDLRSTL